MSGGRRFSRRDELSHASPASPSFPSPLNLSSSSYNSLAVNDPPIRRSRNLPGNSKPASPAINVSSPYGRSPVIVSSPGGSSQQERSARFARRDSGPNTSPSRSGGMANSPSSSSVRHQFGRRDENSVDQNIADWNMPRKRGQTPVSEAKFYSQLEKVSKFMRMMKHKEQETKQMNNAMSRSNPNQSVFGLEEDSLDSDGKYPTLDLLSPDFEGKQKIVVRQDILTHSEPEVQPDLMNFSPALAQAPRGGRFGLASSAVGGGGVGGSFGMVNSSPNGGSHTFLPIQDNRKLKSSYVDAKYSHRSEIDDIEVEMSFLLQSASNAVIEIIPKNVLDEYLEILVFFGSRSGLWCRHALVKLTEHLEIDFFQTEISRLPLYEFKMEYSLEGVWSAAEAVFSKMMNYITLDHLFLNLKKKCTPQSYDNVVKLLHLCLPLEANGAASPERIIERTQAENNRYFRFIFTDLWNLHTCLHPVLIKRLDSYLANDKIKPLLRPADFSGISPHTVTTTEGVKYLQRLQSIQRLDQFISIPTICEIVKAARLSTLDKRIQYAHSVINCYSDVMSLNADVQSKAENVVASMQIPEFTQYVAMLMKSYMDMRGIVMFRHAILCRLADYMQCSPLTATVRQTVGDVQHLEVLYHYVLLQTFVQNWEKFGAKSNPLAPIKEQAQSDSSTESSTEQSSIAIIGSPVPHKSYRKKIEPPAPASGAPNKRTTALSAVVSDFVNDSMDPMTTTESDAYHESLSDMSDTDSDDEQLLARGKRKNIIHTPSTLLSLHYDKQYERVLNSDAGEDSHDDEYRRSKRPNYAGLVADGSPEHKGKKAEPNPPSYDVVTKASKGAQGYHELIESLEQGSTDTTNEQKAIWTPLAALAETRATVAAEMPKPDVTFMNGKANVQVPDQVTIVRGAALTSATQYQIASNLAPSGELPEDLQRLILSQAQHNNFLSTQNYLVFPYRKELASLYLREFQLNAMPSLLKFFSLDKLVELPTYVEQFHFRYLEEFEFLGLPIAELSRNFLSYVEQFFTIHYSDDVLMTASHVHQNPELLRQLEVNLRTKWVITPGFELLAFKRIAEYIDDDRTRNVVQPAFAQWNILNLYIKIVHSPFVEHIDAQVKDIATNVVPTLLRHYSLPTLAGIEAIRSRLREFSTASDKMLIGKFFEFAFDLRNEVLAQPQVFVQNEQLFPPYLDYMIFIASQWVNVKILVLARLRVYVQSYSTDLLTKYIKPIDPSLITLSDIDARILSDEQRKNLGEDLSILFSLWNFKAFYPKKNNRVDINNQEFADRRSALQEIMWDHYESNSGAEWKLRVKGVHARAWSMNVWLYNWPANYDHALLLSLKEGDTLIIPEGAKKPPSANPEGVELVELDSDGQKQVKNKKDKNKKRTTVVNQQLPLTWHELEGHPGVMWTGIIYKGVRLRFLKAVDRKSMDAVMGTIGSDVPAHAMWRYSATLGEMEDVIRTASTSDLRWAGLVMPIVFVVGNRTCPFHPTFVDKADYFAKKENPSLLCSGSVQPICIPEHYTSASSQDKELEGNYLRGTTNLISTTMTLFYDAPYVQNASRYATFLSRHMWKTLHAWSIAIHGIIFVWNIVQCALDIDPNIGNYLIFGLWMLALVFVTFFVEISVASKSPRFVGQFFPGRPITLVIRTVMLIILLFFGLGQYFYAKKMVQGDPYKVCMPMGFGDFLMVNLISHVHIALKHVFFNRSYRPEMPV